MKAGQIQIGFSHYLTLQEDEGNFSIPHFKGLGMRNLQYEMRICQKSNNKITKTVYVWFAFL